VCIKTFEFFKKLVGRTFTAHKILQGILKNETFAINETKCFEK
jgi:hypothetical protein